MTFDPYDELGVPRDMRGRFSVEGGDDPIRRSFDRQIESNLARKEQTREQMEIRRRALLIIGKYRFEWDRPKPPGYERGAMLSGVSFFST